MSTDLEDFRAITAHRRPGRVLYAADFVEDLRRRVIEHIGADDIAGHYGFFEPVELPVRRPEGLAPQDYSRYWAGADLPEGTTFDEHGVAMAPSGFYHFWGYISPLREAKSLSEIENYPLDDPGDWDLSYMSEIVRHARAEGRVASIFVGHMYETAWQIRGYEQFLMDTVDRPAWAQCLLERLAQGNRARAVAAAKAGADWIRCGDDVANQKTLMFSPQTWQKLIHSRWASIWADVKSIHPEARIWYHSDGNIIDVVGEMADAGLDILNPLQPECLDIDRVHRRWGRRLTLDGCIGTQSTMPWGAPDDVRARVAECIEKYGRDGGLMLAPTHVLEPEVPLANIDAFAEACRDCGSFE